MWPVEFFRENCQKNTCEPLQKTKLEKERLLLFSKSRQNSRQNETAQTRSVTANSNFETESVSWKKSWARRHSGLRRYVPALGGRPTRRYQLLMCDVEWVEYWPSLLGKKVKQSNNLTPSESLNSSQAIEN